MRFDDGRDDGQASFAGLSTRTDDVLEVGHREPEEQILNR